MSSLPQFEGIFGADRARRVAVARQWIRAAALREEILAIEGLRDPRWAILLDLYVSEATGRAVSIGDACLASGAPTTTALRYLTKMIAERHVTRIDDHFDRRRAHIRLTPKTEAAITTLIDRVTEIDREFGIETVIGK